MNSYTFVVTPTLTHQKCTQFHQLITLPPSSSLSLFLIPNGTGEKPVVIKAETPKDRVPDTPAITYISITGEEIYVFMNV